MENSFFLEESNRYFNEMIEHRRFIHLNPELSFNEVNTSKYIADILSAQGIKNFPALKKKIEGTEYEIGVIAEIGNGERCVALRADIDALPIIENTGLDFSSKNKGIMHACGHDMHTAMLLTAAKILKSIENNINGRIILIFQPAEEMLPGGAKEILESGILNQYNIEAFYGQHINPEIEVGKIAVKSGNLMASTDELHISVFGKSSHAAQPQLGNDVILASVDLIQYYQKILNKYKNPLDSAVISITAINAGNVTNVFPDEAKMLGTMRTYDQNLRNILKDQIINSSSTIVKLYGCSIDLNIIEGYPPVINNELTTEILKKSSNGIIKSNDMLIAEPKMWAEDFAYYSQVAPSTFWFLGVKQKNDDFYPLHNPKLNPSEKAMTYGSALMASTAYNFFKSK